MISLCNENQTLLPSANPSNRITSPLSASLHTRTGAFHQSATMKTIKTDDIFGYWKVIEFAFSRRGKKLFLCECKCGTRRVVLAAGLRRGTSKSCGCFRNFITIKRSTIHGAAKRLFRLSEYTTWKAMIQRCENPNNNSYYRYGGRGIIVCQRWKSFQNFFSDMGKKPFQKFTLDRINNDGNYEPSNCRWADYLTQANNSSQNIILTFNGTSAGISAWSKICGLPSRLIRERVNHGWTVARSLTQPTQKQRKKYAARP